MKYKLRVLSMHELGQRANQEDYMYPAPGMATDNDRCFVLCDGMGGHDSGEVASQTVCNAMGDYVKEHSSPDDVFTPEQLAEAVSAAYDALDARDTHAVKKMGTTMTFACFNAGGCLVAHMGDSRVYHLRPSMGILFETRDHSLVNDLIKVGELTEETAKDFGQKNVITRCLQPNTERRSRADVREITDIRPGDYFFMCSDGVNEVMESKHLENVILDNAYSDEEKLKIIINSTADARDNHTAFLIHVLDVNGAIPVKPILNNSVGNNFNQSPAVQTNAVSANSSKRPMIGLYIALVVAAVLLFGALYYFLAGSGDSERENSGGGKYTSSTTQTAGEIALDDTPVVEDLEDTVYPEIRQVGSKFVFLDNNGNHLFGERFDYAEDYSCGLALVKKDGKYGYIDIEGELVIPYKYDKAQSFIDYQASVECDGIKLIIDVSGNEVPVSEEPSAAAIQPVVVLYGVSAVVGNGAEHSSGKPAIEESQNGVPPLKPEAQDHNSSQSLVPIIDAAITQGNIAAEQEAKRNAAQNSLSQEDNRVIRDANGNLVGDPGNSSVTTDTEQQEEVQQTETDESQDNDSE